VTDEELMIACGGGPPGSDDAFAELFARFRPVVWGFFRRRVSDISRAEDLTQETFVALLKGARRYEVKAPFRSFLFGIAYNVLSEERRRIRPAGSAEDLTGLAAAAPDLDIVMHVRHAIASLDPIDRDVLLLREFETLSYAEIAATLDVPVNTVRSRLFRARMAVREKLR
jgi:RNA polymerase sigma-70 factor (ECF subfamily)